jgi:hypothetical protein
MEGPTRATLACRCFWQGIDQKGGQVVKNISRVFALALSVAGVMAVMVVWNLMLFFY